MTYTEGQLLSFTPFAFKNGAEPKKKYDIVLKHIDDNLMMASLPTSKDHIPSDVSVVAGCIHIPERMVNAYVFMPDKDVTDSFRFTLPTFIYGEQVDEYSKKYLDEMDSEIESLGIIHEKLFVELKTCLRQSSLLKRRYRKFL